MKNISSNKFLNFILESNIIKFGSFITKSGRVSPYFFNTGLFNNGFLIKKLSEFYSDKILSSKINFDMLFGSAYKGIPLVTSIAISLSNSNNSLKNNIPFAFNRKEIKDHGEGGIIIGANLTGNVLIIDDVITSGLSIYESINIVKSLGANPAGIIVAMDRMEQSKNDNSSIYCSASEEIKNTYDLPVISLISVKDILRHITGKKEFQKNYYDLKNYIDQYCIV
ncbi:Orotate phosphoribosyltransferase [Candidatus Kinetoplastibacterium sorsogonicusi]|uniref:Orotate phosphoribosyltransferase n=1 Tax=Candidatus Kinetoplastidibacterium kentomonadis TaxID=1576550 RepID=A0A3S7JAP6_9PROT|nr:orotate phosphoribosyltransferase [Candidatus Kinetoplastibacterium sorsogonicusi]AWD32741.1 Orotate phosphoribosyltransferase [Candidatus Kinetoplastibacterium sorsogonicusi]